MRVAIDGAQSTGKTTLLSHLRPLLRPEVLCIPEASRVIAPTFGVTAGADWPALLSNRQALAAFFQAEEEWLCTQENSSESFLVDSSVWMIAAYRKHFGCETSDPIAPKRRYDLILRCTIAAPAANDGFRFVEGRDSVDAIHKDLLRAHFAGRIVELPVGPSRYDMAQASVGPLLA